MRIEGKKQSSVSSDTIIFKDNDSKEIASRAFELTTVPQLDNRLFIFRLQRAKDLKYRSKFQSILVNVNGKGL
ncbi:unnamed protein product, partial [Brenthis ino]